ncbi:putative oxidoreductase [Mycolicibacterium sp. BK556]|uniref:DoxX family protein n=1 Tax=unclassified Mycolicibacterium TaxID=2636767 RepID=UPI00160852FF|nr:MULTISPECIES: DoxX family protein [unclassified Mycolicibacterium]MBB3603435.1 putative oxidoreductase [Mycolicibacterium sp. BK556]MBB3633630.1 putative oxidoreductase [Mycolicibacterium sp. BK607]
MTQRLDARLDRNAPAALSVFRIFFGLLFGFEGLSKIFSWPAPIGEQAGITTGSWPYWYAGVLEIILGALITVGLFTRIAAFIACGQMAVAYFTQHIEKSFWPVVNGGELAVALCFGFLLLVFTGGGAYALDAARGKR